MGFCGTWQVSERCGPERYPTICFKKAWNPWLITSTLDGLGRRSCPEKKKEKSFRFLRERGKDVGDRDQRAVGEVEGAGLAEEATGGLPPGDQQDPQEAPIQ